MNKFGEYPRCSGGTRYSRSYFPHVHDLVFEVKVQVELVPRFRSQKKNLLFLVLQVVVSHHRLHQSRSMTSQDLDQVQVLAQVVFLALGWRQLE